MAKTRYLSGRTGGDRFDIVDRIGVGNRQWDVWPYGFKDESHYEDQVNNDVTVTIKDRGSGLIANIGLDVQKTCEVIPLTGAEIRAIEGWAAFEPKRTDLGETKEVMYIIGAGFFAQLSGPALLGWEDYPGGVFGVMGYAMVTSDYDSTCAYIVGIEMGAYAYDNCTCEEVIGSSFDAACSGNSVVDSITIIKAKKPYISVTGTVSKLYGIYIEEQTSDYGGYIGEKWQFYSEAGKHYFGGPVLVGADSTNMFNIEFEPGVDISFGRGSSDPDITYLTLRNADGELCYIYPNADQDGIVVSASKP